MAVNNVLRASAASHLASAEYCIFWIFVLQVFAYGSGLCKPLAVYVENWHLMVQPYISLLLQEVGAAKAVIFQDLLCWFFVAVTPNLAIIADGLMCQGQSHPPHVRAEYTRGIGPCKLPEPLEAKASKS